MIHHKRSKNHAGDNYSHQSSKSYLDCFAVIENPRAAACRYKFLHFLNFLKTGSAKVSVSLKKADKKTKRMA
jgi:hypothetical protein